jgi:hypothetical protein
MSCEVICCEVPELLSNLVECNNGRLLNKLFSFLHQQTILDCYLAGYFEKILEMLFRKLTNFMMNYFNSYGIQLLKIFLYHVDNYSIMQIIQRLMLPHLPFAAPSDNPTEETISPLLAGGPNEGEGSGGNTTVGPGGCFRSSFLSFVLLLRSFSLYRWTRKYV